MLPCERLSDWAYHRSTITTSGYSNGFRFLQCSEDWLCSCRSKPYNVFLFLHLFFIYVFAICLFQALKHLLETYNEDKVKLVLINLNAQVRYTLEKLTKTKKIKYCHSSSTLYDEMFELMEEPETKIPLIESWPKESK